MMNIRKRTEKKGICNVLLCVALCGTTLCACKSGSDAEKVDLGSYTYGEEEHQCSDAAKEEPDGEDYLVPIVEGNRGFFSEMNGAWFVDDSDRFYYYEEYEPLHDGYGAGVWEIRLGEMKGDGKLAQAVNRYHEELYESRKAEMKAFQEEVTALSAEDLQEWDDFWKANANIFTMAAFRWGNLFTVVNMDYVGYKSCGIVPAASFNITTGEKYEIGDLFCTENYREELLEIIEKEAVRNEYFDWWDDDLQPGGFTYLISYHGLLIGETYGTRYVLVKWEDMRDILSPEFVSDVLVYADWNND